MIPAAAKLVLLNNKDNAKLKIFMARASKDDDESNF